MKKDLKYKILNLSIDKWVTFAVVAIFTYSMFGYFSGSDDSWKSLVLALLAATIIATVNQIMARNSPLVRRTDRNDLIRWSITLLLDTVLIRLLNLNYQVFTAIWFLLTISAVIDNDSKLNKRLIAIIGLVSYFCFTTIFFNQLRDAIINSFILLSIVMIILKENIDFDEKILQMENELIQKEKLATVGLMSAGISHEFNNSLNNLGQGIEASLELIEKNELIETKDILGDMKKVVMLAAETIDSMRNLNKITDRVENIDLKNFVGTLLNLHKGLTFEFFTIINNVPPDLQITFNRLVLYNALANVIKNAIEASEKAIEKKIVIDATKIGEEVAIDISDYGVGVDDSIKNKVFHNFSTKENGLGFGLSFSREKLVQAGGNLELVSLVNPTKFRISIKGLQ